LQGLLSKNEGEVESKSRIAKKRKWTRIEEAEPPLSKKAIPYVVKPSILKLIPQDVLNERNWEAAMESIKLGYPVSNFIS